MRQFTLVSVVWGFGWVFGQVFQGAGFQVSGFWPRFRVLVGSRAGHLVEGHEATILCQQTLAIVSYTVWSIPHGEETDISLTWNICLSCLVSKTSSSPLV